MPRECKPRGGSVGIGTQSFVSQDEELGHQRPRITERETADVRCQGKGSGGASPFFFVPGTLWRTWGTRPVLTGFFLTSEGLVESGLTCAARSSSCLRQSSESTK